MKTDDGQPEPEFAPYSTPAGEPTSDQHHLETLHEVTPQSVAPTAPVQSHDAEPAAAPITVVEPAVEPAAEEAKAAHREVELLPEAPAPQQKRGGWWQRAKSTLSGN